ncbi:hypothetical protein WIN67_17885 [Pseudomonas idahonensis]|uniref:hypothetical protein n=1 Tax=Pseudomonas idahonensis TaxID=2942628 RepID=UPI0030CBC019
MGVEEMRDDEFKPTCPKCSGIEFVAVSNRYVARTSEAISMVVCADLKCQTVVGVLPKAEVFPD